MGRTDVLWPRRVGWWAGGEPADPLAALTGSLLRAEIRARCPGLSPVLVHGAMVGWAEPGFTGEPAAVHLTSDGPGEPLVALSVLVLSGGPEPGGSKIARALTETGAATVAIAPEEGWGLEPSASVGPPFAVPEPVLLAARHLSRHSLDARGAFLRVVEGLPRHYVLVEGCLLDGPGEQGAEDLELALVRLARAAGGDRPAEVVKLVSGPLAADYPGPDALLVARRAETEEGRHQPEDWEGDPDRPRMALRVANPVDLAAVVAGAEAVVARTGALMALAWALGTPHVAVAGEDSPASNFAAWTGDASALAQDGAAIVAGIDNIFARRAGPAGSNDWRLRWTSPSTTLLTTWSRRWLRPGQRGPRRSCPRRPCLRRPGKSGPRSSRRSMRRSASAWPWSVCASASAPPCWRERPTPASNRPSRPCTART